VRAVAAHEIAGKASIRELGTYTHHFD